MSNYSKTVGALVAASTLVAGYALAGTPVAAPATYTPAPTGGLEGRILVGYANMYEFRFFDVGSNLFELGVDVAYETGPVTLNAGAWYGSWDNDTVSRLGNPDSELDLYAGIGTDLGPVAVELGYIYYYYPGFSDNVFNAAGAPGQLPSKTQEIYLSAGVDIFWDMNLGSTAFWDFDSYNGLYIDTVVTKSFEFNQRLGLDLAAGFGYANGHGQQGKAINPGGNRTKDGYQGYYLSAQLPWEFRDGVTLTPYVKYTDGDSNLSTGPNLIDAGQDFFIAGIKLGVTF